jgi:endonuclease G
MNSLSITLVLCFSGVSSMASAHGGGVDGQGGHNNRSAGNYHFHRGPLDGRTYDSKEEAGKALSANSPGVANEAATDSNRSTERPFFDLAPYQPSAGPEDQIVIHKAYTFQYNEAHEQAAWVLYRITAEQLRARVSRTDDFRRDRAVSTGSATLADYRRSGYDRGHLAPAAAMAWSQEVMSESFYLSNMSPQDPGFNRGIWRQLEARVRDWADLHGEVFVVTGPVLESELPTIGPSGVSVPAYYYKVVVDLRPPGVEGVGGILPNGSAGQSIGRYAVSIDSVEAFTGIDFFPVLADSVEEEIEGNLLGEHWGLEMGEVSTTRKLDSWGQIKAE